MSKLFSSTRVGPYELKHRVVLAPLTRMRTEPGDVPGDLMVDYYSQRASEGGLLITDATAVSPLGIAYVGAPGIYTDAQVNGWKRVTDAVHARGGRIFLQLWPTQTAKLRSLLRRCAPKSMPRYVTNAAMSSKPNRSCRARWHLKKFPELWSSSDKAPPVPEMQASTA